MQQVLFFCAECCHGAHRFRRRCVFAAVAKTYHAKRFFCCRKLPKIACLSIWNGLTERFCKPVANLHALLQETVAKLQNIW